MNQQLRAFLAILAGIISGAIVIAISQMLTPYHPDPNMDYNDKTAMAEFVKTLPMQAFLIVLLGYFLGALVGGWVTNFVARPTRFRPALITGTGLFVFGLMNLLAIPHPTWFALISSLLFFIGAWIGGRAARRGEASA